VFLIHFITAGYIGFVFIELTSEAPETQPTNRNSGTSPVQQQSAPVNVSTQQIAR